MAANPLASQMKKEEQLFAAEIANSVNKALQSKDTQKKADAATNSSTRTPPRPSYIFGSRVSSSLKSNAWGA